MTRQQLLITDIKRLREDNVRLINLVKSKDRRILNDFQRIEELENECKTTK